MGAYTCTKPATFAGKKYLPGDTVPAEAIPADRVGAVISLGLITPQQAGGVEPQAPAPATITLPIKTADGTVDMEVEPETVVEAVITAQMTADEAVAHIAEITDATALIVIDACDSRKTVKKAAADRAAELEAAAGAAE